MARASYSTTPLLRSLVHRPQGVILVVSALDTEHIATEQDTSGRSKLVLKCLLFINKMLKNIYQNI